MLQDLHVFQSLLDTIIGESFDCKVSLLGQKFTYLRINTFFLGHNDPN